MLQRTLKAAQHHETDLREAKAWIDEIVDGLVRANAIDDSRYADGKTLTMLRRGQSSRKVRAYLASKGVNASTINAALSAATESLGDADLEAAQAYALRRRFGPFRTQEASAETKHK